MKQSIKTGLCFGMTSGIITTMGLMTGLASGTNSRIAVIGGIFTIAIADAFSDALGIHISEESENRHTQKEIWESTISTFIVKFLMAISFAFPVMFISLSTAVIANIAWGVISLSLLSLYIATENKEKTWNVICEHLVIALVVVAISHAAGIWISGVFA